MLGIVLGIIMILPWLITQIMKVEFAEDKIWNYVFTVIAIFGVVCISFLR